MDGNEDKIPTLAPVLLPSIITENGTPDSAQLSPTSVPNGHKHDGIDDQGLLELCDAARRCLQRVNSFDSSGDEVISTLGVLVKTECLNSDCIDIMTIRHARLDKLLCDVTNYLPPDTSSMQLKASLSVAESLQRQWTTRFKSAFSGLDGVRYQDLCTTGPLKNVTFDIESKSDYHLWNPQVSANLSELEGNQEFVVGDWWLDQACAYRDGLVSTDLDPSFQHRHGIPALALTAGTEGIVPDSRVTKYTREGSMSAMLIPLMSRVGMQIRVIRGYRLRSPLAPEAGFRYDGQYVIRQYGQRRTSSEFYRLSLVLEKVLQEGPVDEAIHIPRPSQMDDWGLFQKYEAEMVKEHKGQTAYLQYEAAKAKEMVELRQWKRSLGIA